MFTETWQQGVNNQQAYIRDFENAFAEVEKRVAVSTLHAGTEPTAAQLQAGWQAGSGYDDYIPAFGKVQWYNPNRSVVENIYMPINDIGTNLSSGTPFAMQKKQTTTDVEVISYFQMLTTTTPVSTVNIPVSSNYSHLLVLYGVKSRVAGASEFFQLRMNALAGANYDYAAGTIVSPTATVVGSAAAATTQGFLITSPGATTDKNSYAFGVIEIPQYTVSKTNQIAFNIAVTNTGVAPLDVGALYISTIQYKLAITVTSLTFFETSNFAPGTWILVLGIK